MLKVQGHSTSNPNSIAQYAAIEALKGQESVAEMLTSTRRGEPGCLLHCEIPRLSCNEPEGCILCFPSVRECFLGELRTSADFASRLLTEEHTVVTDGAAFGAEGYLRMSYATSMEQLVEGVTRIRRFVERLNS